MTADDGFFEQLKRSLTAQRLQELSLSVIAAYRSRNEAYLRSLYATLFPDRPGTDEPLNCIFQGLIRHVHPDRLSLIHRELAESFKSADEGKIVFFRTLITAETEVKRRIEERFEFDSAEEFGMEAGDPDGGGAWESGTEWADEEQDRDSDDEYGDSPVFGEDEDEEVSFVSTVRRELFGNLDFSVGPSELESLEGELDLSSRGITDLYGLQFCRNLSRLDLSDNMISNIHEVANLGYLTELYLSGNEISDIDAIATLENLEVLDISRNDIEDIAPLLTLESLLFVNLGKNPLSGALPVIEALSRRGVTVLR